MTAPLAALVLAVATAGADRAVEPSRPAPPVRLRVEAGPDGAPVAFREGDPSPLRGVAIYRAVLRLDLVERHDRARITRRALLVGGAVALLGGPALGYAFGSAAARPTVNCWVMGDDGQPIPQCRPNADIERENDQKLRRGVLVGTGVGVALSALLVTAGLSVDPAVPDLAEAQALVARFNARLERPAGVTAPRARLRLEPLEGGGWVGVVGTF
ncbi:hypothetical protein [Anaeromyxobacter sp. Fw109-5]|uniref:hypothetical protein n=1 Tax=Anaeromyxobacter sp. (strain Fw109-5) TaxID=404589 RepID=UPI0000ED7CCA|nr:hypothetical protein [Anaeromyxobacter sp. Fw109-5]ABS25676.1 hypothetical protein Anae109_1469 [Anaeromyxobacter sp. Fw109-5]